MPSDSIVIIRTPPGRRPRPGRPRLGTYQALFIYEIESPILDANGEKVAPTKSVGLIFLLGQTWLDRYLSAEDLPAFDSGDGAWEYVGGEREIIREPDGSLRAETGPEVVERLTLELVTRKPAALAEWTEIYQFAGLRIDASQEG